MTAPVLSFRHVFGVKSDVSGPLLYVDDSTVLFAAGHQIVLHNTQTRQQRTIPASYDAAAHTVRPSTGSRPYCLALTDPRAALLVLLYGRDMNGPQGATDICALALSPNKRSAGAAPIYRGALLWLLLADVCCCCPVCCVLRAAAGMWLCASVVWAV